MGFCATTVGFLIDPAATALDVGHLAMVILIFTDQRDEQPQEWERLARRLSHLTRLPPLHPGESVARHGPMAILCSVFHRVAITG
jgi:hypothetical protein